MGWIGYGLYFCGYKVAYPHYFFVNYLNKLHSDPNYSNKLHSDPNYSDPNYSDPNYSNYLSIGVF